jgi:hypothetical protein
MRAYRAWSDAFPTHADSWFFVCNPLKLHCAVSLLLEKKRRFINQLEGTLTPSILVRIQVFPSHINH